MSTPTPTSSNNNTSGSSSSDGPQNSSKDNDSTNIGNNNAVSTIRSSSSITNTIMTFLSQYGIFRTADQAASAMYGGESCQNKVFLVTGAYSGIGIETVKTLLKAGAKKVIIGGRNERLQKQFILDLEKEEEDGGGLYNNIKERVDGSHCIDLADLYSVQQFAFYVRDTYPIIDVLICNAGVMNVPPSLTKQNIEIQVGVNCVGHFLLTQILLKQTKRQVWVSSYGHTIKGGERINIQRLMDYTKTQDFSNYDGFIAYQQSKLGNILLAKEYCYRYPNIEAVSLHPGSIYTPLYRATGLFSALQMALNMLPDILRGNIYQVFPKLPSVGASTTITCATMSSSKLVRGGYYSNCFISNESDAARNVDDAKAFFDYCDQITKEFQ